MTAVPLPQGPSGGFPTAIIGRLPRRAIPQWRGGIIAVPIPVTSSRVVFGFIRRAVMFAEVVRRGRLFLPPLGVPGGGGVSGPIDPAWPSPGQRGWASEMNAGLGVVVARLNLHGDQHAAGGFDPVPGLGPTVGSDRWLTSHAGGNAVALMVGAITCDIHGAAISAGVVWPDGTTGTYTATTVSSSFPGLVDAYTVTYGSPTSRTVTQAAVTRDPATGAVTNRPAMTVG